MYLSCIQVVFALYTTCIPPKYKPYTNGNACQKDKTSATSVAVWQKFWYCHGPAALLFQAPAPFLSLILLLVVPDGVALARVRRSAAEIAITLGDTLKAINFCYTIALQYVLYRRFRDFRVFRCSLNTNCFYELEFTNSVFLERNWQE